MAVSSSSKSSNKGSEGLAIQLPFLRGQRYGFAALRAFETALLNTRQRDSEFSDQLRSNRLSWGKVRNEELLPILLLGNSAEFADGDEFELMPEGHAVDIQLHTRQDITAYQITVADPSWGERSAANGSYLYHLRTERLRAGDPAFGGAHTWREGGIIHSTPHARDAMEDMKACQQSLTEAVKRKQAHDGSECVLLIYARGHRFLLIDFDIKEVVAQAVRAAGATTFKNIIVVDDGLLWESSPRQ